MANIDPLSLARAGSSIVESSLKKISGVSPTRKIFVNPRKYFSTDETFDYGKVISEVLKSSMQEYILNIAAYNIPESSLLIGMAQSQISKMTEGADGKYYMFYINPATMRVNHQKITNEVLTGGGWDFDVLGDNLSTYTFTGSSGSFLSENLDLFSIKLSRAFFKFVAFEQFYLYNNNDPLLMILDQTCYVGKLVNMEWNWNADDIYQIKYSYTWKMDPLYSFDLLTGMGITTIFNSSDLAKLFNPAIQENLFSQQNSFIDTYEESMSLFE